jgi:L-threonylcarbamoyladenylate synthase
VNTDEQIQTAIRCLQQESPVFFSSVTGTGWLGSAPSEKVAAAFVSLARLHRRRLFILLAEERDIYRYVAAPDPDLLFYLEEQPYPVAAEMTGWLGLPETLNETNPPAALLLSPDLFVRHLVRRLGQPLLWLPGKADDIKYAACHIPSETTSLTIRPLTVIRWEGAKPVPAVEE